MDAVTAVLLERTREERSLRPMVAWSRRFMSCSCVALVAGQGKLFGTSEPQPREIMTISLGGAPGPRAGGANPLGGRPVQRAIEAACRRGPSRFARRRRRRPR